MDVSIPLVIEITHDDALPGTTLYALISRIGLALKECGLSMEFTFFDTSVLAVLSDKKTKKSRIKGRIMGGLLVIGGAMGGAIGEGAGERVGDIIVDTIRDALSTGKHEQTTKSDSTSEKTGPALPSHRKTHVEISDGDIHIEIDVSGSATIEMSHI
jgi:hypothetical protein